MFQEKSCYLKFHFSKNTKILTNCFTIFVNFYRFEIKNNEFTAKKSLKLSLIINLIIQQDAPIIIWKIILY